MSFFDVFRRKIKNEHEAIPTETFDQVTYFQQIKANTESFETHFNLENIDDIQSITINDAEEWGRNAAGVPDMPEQILFKKATALKNRGEIDIAIACLKKANEIMPYSLYTYHRDDYERLVDYLVLAEKFDEARAEHCKLDSLYGSTIQYLELLKTKSNDPDQYEKTVIKPKVEEERDRSEYYWLLENIKERAPKSFGGYRRMKSGKTENFNKILIALSERGQSLDKINFWGK